MVIEMSRRGDKFCKNTCILSQCCDVEEKIEFIWAFDSCVFAVGY